MGVQRIHPAGAAGDDPPHFLVDPDLLPRTLLLLGQILHGPPPSNEDGGTLALSALGLGPLELLPDLEGRPAVGPELLLDGFRGLDRPAGQDGVRLEPNVVGALRLGGILGAIPDGEGGLFHEGRAHLRRLGEGLGQLLLPGAVLAQLFQQGEEVDLRTPPAAP